MAGPRLIVIVALALAVVYWSLWQYLRAGQRDRLARQWARERPPLPEHTHVEIGLREAAPALRRALVLWVLVVPLAALAAAILLLNAI